MALAGEVDEEREVLEAGSEIEAVGAGRRRRLRGEIGKGVEAVLAEYSLVHDVRRLVRGNVKPRGTPRKRHVTVGQGNGCRGFNRRPPLPLVWKAP
ncbi:hypothetical protein GN244_ATG04436 [Phytophthora infestans]|uniref:Uncharacterized protein n=1 Tax=Phytophthora infestans TaxID=4787 RepID=A0A833SZY1_PHYIN|nr:hypothetical protein GN244_ATG04436 [Phytophthora infestans]KAF4135583.1 hypothetical protein GN958_ATG15232 [Phytophthora infestans]